ncbi:hypothetical protein JST99_05130 [Candidatus Dependentiae bacterium]|nr:hypothetical protein [Candidatus Dependentiae bacterium]
MLKRIATALWGKFESSDEIKKFGLLALIFGLIIAVYWGMRPIKDSIFGAIVGFDYQPLAKMLSLCVATPLVILYGKLIDRFPRQNVFYGLTAFYGVAALAFAAGFMHPTIGLSNVVEDPSRWIGWAWYVYVESFGSLIVALFWAFTTDITDTQSAQRGFPLIALFGQMGNIFGPYLLQAKRYGLGNSAPIVAVIGVLIFVIGLLLWVFTKIIPAAQMSGYHAADGEEKHSEPGLFEGLRLLLTQGYLFGIFLVIFFYEVILTIFDFHFKSAVKAIYPAEADNAAYLSDYAVWVGIVATACVFFGINNIQRHLGMRASLILLPLLIATAVGTLWLYPTAINVAFWIMVLSKAINYALNQPTLKQLYIPTTKDAKYKAQAWIEMFGSRGSKAAGSTINSFKKPLELSMGKVAGGSTFIAVTTLSSGVMILVWLFAAVYVAKRYTHAVNNKQVVC